MKTFFATLVIGLATWQAHTLRLSDTPMSKVVSLLKKMEAKIEGDAKSEQASYDKLACWCEESLAEKAEDITKAKDKLEELQNNINKNKGFLGSNGANLGQLKKDIAENLESQKEATAVRKKENTAYEDNRVELEQSIGGLEAAVKVLTGAGAGKKGFLETYHEAQLLSVVAGVRGVLRTPKVRQMSNTDLRVVQHFVEKPEDFVKSSGSSAMQVSNNPFGDYAPQSTQIQGILKSMYDSFTGDLETENAEEGEKQKAFEELMATKKKELNTLQSTLETTEKDEAEKTKSVADDKDMRDETKEKLEADSEFFKSTTDMCGKKAKQWTQRSHLRTMELAGISKAIEILDSDDAKKTFKEASTSFLQVSSPAKSRGDGAMRAKGYKRLKTLASRFQNLKLAQLAVVLKTGGHFDDVIAMIDEMIATLRQEAQEDIAHRDRCENKQNANTNNKEDAEHEISKAKDELERLEQAIKDKKDEIKTIEGDMKKTRKEQDEITKQREKETAAFVKAVKADEDSIELLGKASRALAKYYENNKFVQLTGAKQAEGTAKLAMAKPPPETNWDAEGGDYKGEAGGARGILGMLDMIIQDLQAEIKSARQDEADEQADYEADHLSLERSWRASKKSKIKAQGELAELKGKKSDVTEFKEAQEEDLKDEKKLAKAIAEDCDWIKSHFEKRVKARKAETEGLQDAKDFLAGVGTDSDLEMP